MKKKHETEWKTLFDIMLDIPYDLETGCDKVVLMVDSQYALKAKESLESKLGNASAFWKSMPYQINTNQPESENTSKPLSYPERIKSPENKEEAVNALKSFFGPGATEFGSLAPENLSFEKGILSLKAESYSKRNILKEKASWLMLHFANADKNTLGEIWSKPELFLPEPDSSLTELEINENGLSEGLLTQCFRIEAFKDKNQARLVVDLGLLYQLIYPVEIKLENANNSKVRIEIDRRHLFNNIRQITNGEFLLRIYQSAEEAKARVLLFNSAEYLPKEHTHILLIDKSFSLNKSYESANGIRQQLNNFLQVLQKEDPASTVKLVFFSDKIELAGEYSVLNVTEIQQAIVEYTRELGVATLLFDACINTFKDLNSHINERSVSVTLFTDGINEGESKSTQNDVISSIDKIPYKQRPKILTIGTGSYDAGLLDKMANQAGGQFIHIENANTLESALVNNIEAMSTDRRLIEFMYELDKQVNSYNIPLLENEFSMPEIILPIAGNKSCVITVDGKKFPIEINQKELPKSNTTDELATYAVKQTELLSNGKLQQLNELKKDFETYKNQKLASMNPNDLQYAEQITKRIDEGITDLSKASNNERMQTSIKSLARGKGGFYAVATNQTASSKEESHTPQPF